MEELNKGNFLKGSKYSLVIGAGYIPLGIACGIVCSDAGLTVFQIGIMSLLVFAGAGQYIAGAMIAGGASPLSIIFTTFIVNSRHILYTSVLYPYVSRWSFFKQCLFASEITDEVFAMHTNTMNKNGAEIRTAFGINVFSHSAWILGCVLGAVLSSWIPENSKIGIDFTLYALFAALIIPKIKIKTPKGIKIDYYHLTASITGGLTACIFALFDMLYIGTAAGGILGAFAGIFLKRRFSHEHS